MYETETDERIHVDKPGTVYQTDDSYIHETETTVQEDQPMATGPPEETTDESKDKPSTHASKKPKHD